MRLAEVTTVGEILEYCENYETCMDSYNLLKESMEIDLMEMIPNLTDGVMTESEDDKNLIKEKAVEKRKNLVKQMIETFKNFIKKTFAALLKLLHEKYIGGKAAYIQKNLPSFIEPKEGSQLTTTDIVNRINDQMKGSQLIVLKNLKVNGSPLAVKFPGESSEIPVSDFSSFFKTKLKEMEDAYAIRQKDVEEWEKLLEGKEGEELTSEYYKGIQKSIDKANKDLARLANNTSLMINDVLALATYMKESKKESKPAAKE